MHVAVFGSGSGTILRAMLSAQKMSGFAIKLLFTDKQCNFQQIAREENLPLIEHFFTSDRDAYDREGVKLIASFMEKTPIDCLLLAGYMKILGRPWLEAFPHRILNVHPADLTHLDADGKRKYVGEGAVLQALLDGQKRTRTSVILIDEKIDTGPIVVSGPWVEYEEGEPITRISARAHQERQKALSDWPACLLALQLISQGKVKIDEKGFLCVESLGS